MDALFDLLLALAVLVVPLYAALIAVRWIAQHSRGPRQRGDRDERSRQ